MLTKDEARKWFYAGARAVSPTRDANHGDEFEREWVKANVEGVPLPPKNLQARATALEQYLVSRDAFRESAVREFVEADPQAIGRMALAGEIVASLTLALSGRDLRPIPDGLYIGELVVSFCRTHFAVAEHILQVELIDAKTLLRKQLELLARLHEISKGMHSSRVPQLQHLPSRLRSLYGDYSGTAHSSNDEHLMLLGRFSVEDNTYTPLYPVFDSNACIAVQHACLVCLEFCDYLTSLYERWSFDYDFENIRRCRRELIMELHSLQLASVSPRDSNS